MGEDPFGFPLVKGLTDIIIRNVGELKNKEEQVEFRNKLIGLLVAIIILLVIVLQYT